MTKIFLVLFFCILIVWPIVTAMSYHVAGWKKWQKCYRRDVTGLTDMAASVGLIKFGNYNRCVRIGIEDYGVAFKPTFFLLFHKSFCIPWVQILSFQFTPGKLTSICHLHTSQGDIKIYGDVAEIVARGCQEHYVSLGNQ